MFESKLPKRINVERLCQHLDRLQGQIFAKELPRLLDMVESIETPVKVLLDFKHDEIGEAIVSGFVEAKVMLICQRCMQPYCHEVTNNVNWAVVKNDTKAKQVQQQYDPVLESGNNELELLAQLEDEIILSIPIIPMHENLDDCIREPEFTSAQAITESVGVPVEIKAYSNPFADLANLKKQLTKQKK
jgi:uncharacterized protein